jgi:hypothetical protein
MYLTNAERFRSPARHCPRLLKASHIAVVVLTAFVIVLGPASASATVLIYGLDTEFSGGTAPAGTPPWVTVILNDFGGTGSVELDITGTNLTSDENLYILMLNLDPLLDPNDLTFTFNSKSRVALDAPTISTGVDAFTADGDGKYDIQFEFASGGPPATFVNNDWINYTISGIPSLTVSSFNYLSAPHGGHGPFKIAAHIQNTGGGEESGWVTDITGGSEVPEPSTIALLAFGSIALAGYGIRRRLRR